MRFVAELGSNINGSLDRAILLVEAAARAGFTDVKTQAWRLGKLFAPEALAARPALLERRRFEVPWEWHKPLANRAKELGMGYGVTVFHRDHVRLAAIEADWLKVSSYSLLDRRLIGAVTAQPKPVVLSTGMATEDEVKAALIETYLWPTPILLLHCVSSYPAPPHEANLRSIPYMRERFGVPVGWSDHTVSGIVVGRAQHVYEASMIELHFDLGDGLGEEATHSWTPAEMRHDLVRSFVDGGYYACDGKKGVKAPSVSEDAERAWRADPSDGLRPLLATRQALLAAHPKAM